MRARNLKPSLFKNELLAVADPLYTVIFEGLWCAADREGRLEDRPARIHFEINPGRAFERTVESLIWLTENGFIRRYQVTDRAFIQVVSFLVHQNPHKQEIASVIPPEIVPRSDAVPNQVGSRPASSLIPSSLIPSSLIPSSSSLRSEKRATKSPLEKKSVDNRAALRQKVAAMVQAKTFR